MKLNARRSVLSNFLYACIVIAKHNCEFKQHKITIAICRGNFCYTRNKINCYSISPFDKPIKEIANPINWNETLYLPHLQPYSSIWHYSVRDYIKIDAPPPPRPLILCSTSCWRIANDFAHSEAIPNAVRQLPSHGGKRIPHIYLSGWHDAHFHLIKRNRAFLISRSASRPQSIYMKELCVCVKVICACVCVCVAVANAFCCAICPYTARAMRQRHWTRIINSFLILVARARVCSLRIKGGQCAVDCKTPIVYGARALGRR